MNIDNKEMLTLLGNTIFILSPIIGFIPQLYTRNVVFSPLLSLTLITSAIFKFYYRHAETFSNVLIYQSIVTLITQTFLIYNFKYELGIIERKFYDRFYNTKKHGIFSANLFIVVSVVVSINLLCYTQSFMMYKMFGVISILLESSVGLLQLFMRRAEKDVLVVGDKKRRLPKELFVSWIVGDLGKLYWMYMLNSPLMFTLPVVFQLGVDFLLMLE